MGLTSVQASSTKHQATRLLGYEATKVAELVGYSNNLINSFTLATHRIINKFDSLAGTSGSLNIGRGGGVQ